MKIAGQAHRTFSVPTDLATTHTYYSDFAQVITHVPHIRLVRAYGPHQFRVMYHTTELGVYRVRIYCDLQVTFHSAQQTLDVAPLVGIEPARSRVTVNSLTAQGTYSSQSIFRTSGDYTQIEYQLELAAELPKPLGLSLIPDPMLEQIAQHITDWRIDEIAQGFIDRTTADLRQDHQCV